MHWCKSKTSSLTQMSALGRRRNAWALDSHMRNQVIATARPLKTFFADPRRPTPPTPPPTATAATLHTAFVTKRRGPKARTQLEFTRSTRWPLHDRRCRPAAWQIFTNGSHQAATKRLCRVVL